MKEGTAEPFAWVKNGPSVFRSVFIEVGKGNSVKRIMRMDSDLPSVALAKEGE